MAWEGIKLIACATGASLLSAWCLSQWFEPEPYTVWRGTSSPPDGPLAGAAAPQQRAEPAGVHISGNLYLPDTWGRDLTCLTLELDPAPTWARSRVPVRTRGYTDRTGRPEYRFLFSGIPPGSYRLILNPGGLAFDLEVPDSDLRKLVLEVPGERPAPENCRPEPASPVTLPERPLETSVLVLGTGHRGGIVNLGPEYQAEFSYDWMRRCYRVVEWNPAREDVPGAGGGLWRSDLSAETFRAILDGVLELGLADLPVESPAGEEDIYERATTLRILHRTSTWSNGMSTGCTFRPSVVQPSRAERATFDAAVAFVTERLGELDMQPASRLDEDYADIEDPQLALAFARIVEFLESGELAGRVDFNRLHGRGWRTAELCFAFAEQEFRMVADPDQWDARVGVRLDRASGEIGLELSGLPPAEPEEVRARRRAFVEQHPELPASWRELILRGWVDRGLPPDLVRAAWGEPDHIGETEQGTQWYYSRKGSRHGTSLTFRDGVIAQFR